MRRTTFILTLVLSTVASSTSRADEQQPSVTIVDEARAAYARGAAHYDAGRYGDAAKDLARADVLVNKRTVLELALAAVLRAEDAPLGMSLVDRAQERGLGDLGVTQNVRAKYADKAGQLVVLCAAPACRATVDGAETKLGEASWTALGSRLVVFESGGRTEQREARVSPRQRTSISSTLAAAAPAPRLVSSAPVPAPASAPAPAPSYDAPERAGISPSAFWVSLGVTAALGAASIVSGIDLVAKHNAFERDPTPDGQTDGRAAELRTTVLIAATAAGAITTTALGLLFVRWSSRTTTATAMSTSRPGLEVHLCGGPGAVSLGGSF